MRSVDLFLEKDFNKAPLYLNEYSMLKADAAEALNGGDFEEAEALHRRIAGVMENLKMIKKNKQVLDEAQNLLDQMDRETALRAVMKSV